MKKVISMFVALGLIFMFNVGSSKAEVEKYVIDTEKAHAFIQFKISHLGYSWLYGRFNTFSGSFTYDTKNPKNSTVTIKIDPASVDTNLALRDKHLRGEKFFEVDKFPEATFVSTSYKQKRGGKGVLKGDFTFHGVTKNITIDVTEIGHGEDPWKGYRRGLYGVTTLKLKDYNILKDLGPASQEVELHLSIEGIRQ